MIWTPLKNVSVLVAYHKSLCVGDLYLHEYCFVRCNLSGDTGNNSPLHCKNATQFFSPLLSPSYYYIICIMLETPVGFQGNPLFWVLGNCTARQSMISRACVDNMGRRSLGRHVDLFSVMPLIHAGQKYSCSSLPWQPTVLSDIRAKNNLFELK